MIDKIISIEIPNENNDPFLFKMVKKHMMHGHCGSINKKYSCMDDGQCFKHFPKCFNKKTILGDDGYLAY